MDDPKIDDLCQQIYRNHRQALDLIYERVGAPGAKLVGELEDLLNQRSDRWLVCHRTSKEVHFVPRAWLDVLPPIGRRQNVDPKLWIRLGFWCGEDKCLIWCWGYPTTDPVTRRAALERLTRDFDEFHLRAPKKGITDTWTSLGSETVFSWQDEEEPDKAALITAASKKLEEFWERLASAPAALSEVLPRRS